jgi:CHAT domain-containing protein
MTAGSPDVVARRDPTTRGGQTIPVVAPTPRAWSELYDILIRPIAKYLPATGARLTIVPHGPLLSVPFVALRDTSGRYLIERYAIHSVPASAILRYTEQSRRPGARKGSVLLVADPSDPPKIPGEPPLPALPGADTEVHAIAALWPASKVTLLAHASATEPRVIAATPHVSVLHFATHAVVNDGDPLASFLALGRSADGAATGQLTADKIYGLHLDADLVVLSACRSGEGLARGDGIATLARAFFYAGAPSLIVSLWDVADEPTDRLLPAFYRAWLGGTDKARALRAAQLKLLADLRAGRVTLATPAGPVTLPENPAFWAGFILVGEPD